MKSEMLERKKKNNNRKGLLSDPTTLPHKCNGANLKSSPNPCPPPPSLSILIQKDHLPCAKYSLAQWGISFDPL